MSDQPFDPDVYTKARVITKSYYRDVYPAVDPTRSDLSQAGKVTIVTGAGRGIGVGIAIAHAKSGVRGLVLVGRSLNNIEKVKQTIQAEYPNVSVLTVVADISDESSVNQLFIKTKEAFGVAHTLVNNAGVISTSPTDTVENVSPDTWWNDFNVNVRGTFLVCAVFLRLTIENVVKPTIINIVSNITLTPPSLSSYFGSKAALMKFTEVLQVENPKLAAYSVNPGLVHTDATLEAFAPYAKDTAALVGAVTVYLSTRQPHHLNGRHLCVNWDVEELEIRKEEIENSNLLTMGLKLPY
ncbi:hypothetical protein GQX73_g8622 [Xylaria multiplex]|uniref:Uncharacterized protein n=1 Tax=Xylaria multiplex TaxID=323545 RepID=A0A7C8INH8_9PEZI|nr:hypothetical protein GQX73_g8622 [Xylaria multiplex]